MFIDVGNGQLFPGLMGHYIRARLIVAQIHLVSIDVNYIASFRWQVVIITNRICLSF